MWNDLTMSERAGVIKMAVKAGLRDMKSIRDFYDNSLKYADGGPKKSFDDWYKTVPVDRNDTTNYDLRRAYELAPIKELESWRTSSIKDLRNGKNHLRSVYEDPNTGIYNFVKSKNHPTVGLELDWYNSKDAADFRSKYDLDTSGDYYRYVPKPDYNITLPEVTVLGSKKHADGGSINISPSKRGTFTAAATKHGMGVQEFASRVLANKDNYSPAMVKKANFARNFGGHKHDLGGYLFEEGGPKATYGKPYYSYDKNMQIETDNGKPILNYSATLPEVNIIPDSKKSPADRNESRRFREKVFSDNAEREARDYTQRQIMKSQRDWDNSLEKKTLGYAQDFMTGVGIGADIVSGYPVYSSLKGSRVLSEADSLPEYIEGGLWLAPIGSVVGKETYNVGKNVWNTSKNAIKNTIGNIGKNNKTTPVDFNNLTPEQWTAFQDKAIAEGDMVRAQMLRDLHYKIKTPNNQITTNEGYPAKLLHGTPTKGWHIYDYNKFGTTTDNGMYGKGMYLTGDKDYAGVYAFDAGRTNGEIKQLYAYSKQPFYIRNKENMLPKEKADRVNAAFQFNRSHQYTDDIPQHILDELNRSDAIVEKSIKPVKFNDEYIVNKSYPYGPFNYDEVVIPNTSNVKYADAVTYDKNGVRIPLGERDNFRINDFRYGIIPLIGGASLYKNNRKVK